MACDGDTDIFPSTEPLSPPLGYICAPGNWPYYLCLKPLPGGGSAPLFEKHCSKPTSSLVRSPSTQTLKTTRVSKQLLLHSCPTSELCLLTPERHITPGQNTQTTVNIDKGLYSHTHKDNTCTESALIPPSLSNFKPSVYAHCKYLLLPAITIYPIMYCTFVYIFTWLKQSGQMQIAFCGCVFETCAMTTKLNYILFCSILEKSIHQISLHESRTFLAHK